jgi:hypothetical protein
MALPTKDSPTLAAPRITAARFKQLLQTKNSPSVSDSDRVYQRLVEQDVDVSFALAQFRVESQYGTAGYAKETGSWGNMLWDKNLTLLASGKVTKVTSSGTYTYATYLNYENAILDYCRYIHWYISQYDLLTIYDATGRWIGHTGDAGHLAYVQNIINDMINYEYPAGTFYEVGDKMVYTGKYIDRTTGRLLAKYPVKDGTEVFKGTDGTVLKNVDWGNDANGNPILVKDAWFLGPVQGSWAWGTILLGTSLADINGTEVYIKNPDQSKVKFV